MQTMKWAVCDMTLLAWMALCAFGCAEVSPHAAPGALEDSAPLAVSDHADLHVYLNDYPLIYEDPELFLLDVFFENRGPDTLIILPSRIRRHYSPMEESGAVTYVPRDDDAPSSWEGAFALQPQETKVITLAGMADGDGVWELDKGFYRMSVRYVVTEDATLNGERREGGVGVEEGVLWVGERESQELTVRYEPSRAANPAPDDDQPAPLEQGQTDDARF